MGLLPEEHKQHVKEELNQRLVNKVKLVVFTQETECPFCKETRELIQEMSELSDKIEVAVYDFMKDKDQAALYKVDKVPALVILGEKDYGIRYYGLPFGYEFQTLMEDLVAVSNRNSGLSETTRDLLKTVDKPVHIQVLVTLTCPYCPIIAGMAHKFTMENDLIKADVIDVNEFLQIGIKYNVMGVPKTVINEKVEFLSVVPEEVFVGHVLDALRV
ncbi:MAG TPA: thioredoxin family protein [Candidatus Krumholzibacteriaceae bacterium]|nr:thioredoxin family protein [Candidatus Krumholzibacteriaceae bacterium]